jgi:hypothetical protein
MRAQTRSKIATRDDAIHSASSITAYPCAEVASGLNTTRIRNKSPIPRPKPGVLPTVDATCWNDVMVIRSDPSASTMHPPDRRTMDDKPPLHIFMIGRSEAHAILSMLLAIFNAPTPHVRGNTMVPGTIYKRTGCRVFGCISQIHRTGTVLLQSKSAPTNTNKTSKWPHPRPQSRPSRSQMWQP